MTTAGPIPRTVRCSAICRHCRGTLYRVERSRWVHAANQDTICPKETP